MTTSYVRESRSIASRMLVSALVQAKLSVARRETVGATSDSAITLLPNE